MSAQLPPGGVPLEIDPSITVYPVSFKHLRKFHTAVAKAVGEISKLKVPEGADSDGLFRLAMPMIADDLMDLLDECCVPRLSSLGQFGAPHWVVGEAAEKWFAASFGKAHQLRPWVTAVETLVTAVTGQKTDLWATLSGFYSPAATPAPTSSTLAAPAGLMGDGALASFDTSTPSPTVSNADAA